MHQALLLFSSHFLVHLVSSSQFLINHFGLFLFLGLLLLLLNERFYHGGFGNVLIILVVEKFLLLLLFFLCCAYILFDLFTMGSLIVIDLLSLLLLLCLVEQSHVSFLVHAHLHPHLLFLIDLHVPPPLGHDIAGFLSSLVNLLESTVLLLL